MIFATIAIYFCSQVKIPGIFKHFGLSLQINLGISTVPMAWGVRSGAMNGEFWIGLSKAYTGQ
jgi:hypothetical protein